MHYKNIHTQQIINWEDMEFGTVEKSFCGICDEEEPGYFNKNQELVEDIICDICSKSWVFVDEESDPEDESEEKNNNKEDNSISFENYKNETEKDDEEHIKV
jgi:hypothetical protein